MLKLKQDSFYLVEGKVLKLSLIKEIKNKTEYSFSDFKFGGCKVLDVYHTQKDEVDAFCLMPEWSQIKMMEEGTTLGKEAELVEIQDREVNCPVMIDAWHNALALHHLEIEKTFQNNYTV